MTAKELAMGDIRDEEPVIYDATFTEGLVDIQESES